MSQLPLFSLSTRVNSSQARQDNISMDLGEWVLQSDGAKLGAFFDFLGPRPNPNHSRSWYNILLSTPCSVLGEEHFGTIFNRPEGCFDQQTGMTISGGKGRVRRAGQLLAKGKLHIRHHRAIGPDAVFENIKRRILKFSLKLNPTRFVRHQSIPAANFQSNDSSTLPPQTVFAGQITRRDRVGNEDANATIETSLDGNDNVILGEAALHYARPELWPQHLSNYLRAVESTLKGEIERSAVKLDLRYSLAFSNPALPCRTRYRFTPSYTLRKVETYFEFRSSNPTKLVRELRPALEAIGLNHRTRSFPEGLSLASMGDSNAQSVVIRLSAGVFLRVYAKTTHRIRFEIIHDTTKPAVTKLLQATKGGYVTDSLSEMEQWFHRLTDDAAQRINDLFSSLESQMNTPTDSADEYEFLGAIFSVVRNASRARTISTLLVENGCFRIGHNGTDLLPEIRQLRRIGFLERVNCSDQVTARYRKALDELRTSSGLPKLYASSELLQPPRPARPISRLVRRPQEQPHPLSRLVKNRVNASSCTQ